MTGILGSMGPGMIHALRMLDHDPGSEVHGPMLRGLMIRGLVRHVNQGLAITWAGQEVLNEWRKRDS